MFPAVACCLVSASAVIFTRRIPMGMPLMVSRGAFERPGAFQRVAGERFPQNSAEQWPGATSPGVWGVIFLPHEHTFGNLTIPGMTTKTRESTNQQHRCSCYHCAVLMVVEIALTCRVAGCCGGVVVSVGTPRHLVLLLRRREC